MRPSGELPTGSAGSCSVGRPGTQVRHLVWSELAGTVVHGAWGDAVCVAWDGGWPAVTEVCAVELLEPSGEPARDVAGLVCACLEALTSTA